MGTERKLKFARGGSGWGKERREGRRCLCTSRYQTSCRGPMQGQDSDSGQVVVSLRGAGNCGVTAPCTRHECDAVCR